MNGKLVVVLLALCCLATLTSAGKSQKRNKSKGPWTFPQILQCHGPSVNSDDWLTTRVNQVKSDIKTHLSTLFGGNVKDLVPTKYRKKTDEGRAGLVFQAEVQFTDRADATADIQLTSSSGDQVFYTDSRKARVGNIPYWDVFPVCPYNTNSLKEGQEEVEKRATVAPRLN